MIVVDASVAVKWAVDEPGRDAALRVLDLGQDLVAPDIIFAEVTNVVRKKTRSGEVTHEQATRALQGLKTALARTVSAADLWPDALELSLTLNHSAYDCFYLAAAVGRGILVSADERFVAKARMADLGQFVSLPVDLWTEVSRPAASEVSFGVIQDVRRLSALVQKTFNALGEAAGASARDGTFRFIPVSAYAPAFDSPAYRQLSNILRELPTEHLAQLVALGWLGRPYHRADEWPGLLANAQGMAAAGFERHAAYFMAQMADVDRGLEKLQAAQSDGPS